MCIMMVSCFLERMLFCSLRGIRWEILRQVLWFCFSIADGWSLSSASNNQHDLTKRPECVEKYNSVNGFSIQICSPQNRS